jgi:CHAD domain-containing protein
MVAERQIAMAGGKWIENLPPTTPCLDAARHALTVRLEAIRTHLEETQTQIDRDPEAVHHLRVATRRARAALDIFDDFLPKIIAKKTHRFLRKLRHAAGDVRDWDVFLLDLHARRGAKNRYLGPALDLVSGLALTEREAARDALLGSSQCQTFSFERLANKALAALQAPRGKRARRLSGLAIPLLRKRIRSLEETVGAGSDDLAHFHRMRIEAKHLRYAMEFFGDCFRKEFKEDVYPLVEAMQECLGQIHDSDVAIRRLDHWQQSVEATFNGDWKRYQPGFQLLTKALKATISRERRKFKSCWQRWGEADVARRLANMQVRRQRGELVSIAGRDKSTPGVRGESPGAEVVRPETVPGGSP